MSTERVKFLHSFAIIVIARRVVILSHLFFILNFHSCDISQQGRIYARFTDEETEAQRSKMTPSHRHV